MQQESLFDDNPAYEAFVDKFKPKKTTDDCYTPVNVYEAVANWVTEEYGVSRGTFVRPFWPGGDYERFEYSDGCVVVDNPPFSLLTQIEMYYLSRGIRFFLFAPTLTLFSGGRDLCYLPCGVSIVYDNKAKVNTSFVTNLDSCRVRSAPELYAAVWRENDRNEKAVTKQLPKYEYPDHVLTAAAAYQYSRLGIPYRLEKADCRFIRALDNQKDAGKSIFGGGFLLSDRAAADRAAADRKNCKAWKLSERERELITKMNEGDTSC